MFFKDRKAQGALEYLLIIGGAIVLAAIVIAVVLNLTSNTKGTANDQFDDFNNLINSVELNTTPDSTTVSSNTPIVTEDQTLLENAALIAFGKSLFDSGITTLYTTILETYTKNKSNIPTIESNFKELTNNTFDEKYILNYSGKYAKYWFFVGMYEVAKKTYDIEKMKTCLANNDVESCYTSNADYIAVGKISLNFN